jgi:hypothetical protein
MPPTKQLVIAAAGATANFSTHAARLVHGLAQLENILNYFLASLINWPNICSASLSAANS